MLYNQYIFCTVYMAALFYIQSGQIVKTFDYPRAPHPRSSQGIVYDTPTLAHATLLNNKDTRHDKRANSMNTGQNALPDCDLSPRMTPSVVHFLRKFAGNPREMHDDAKWQQNSLL
jgi:hypothetical protein